MTTELRLALAMRGGVSLAVWIGGAVSEIDLIRRADPTDAAAADFWSQVLGRATDYDQVVVDVLAGASAGGLNGALYAASQVYDFEYRAMRDIWLQVGGTESLVRRDKPWPSLFMGDDYFLTTLHGKLQDLAGPGTSDDDPARPRPRVELALSATLMDPVVRPLPSPQDEPLFERRHAGGFRFRQPQEPWLPTDFAPRPPAARSDTKPSADAEASFNETLWRLAVAARSTSSYPAAFEAAEVRSTRRESFTAAGGASGTGVDVDLDGMFLDRTSKELRFVVADGGILDNIPIQCALDFIAHAPAAGPTERFLLYLQPGASTPQAPDASPGNPDPPPPTQAMRDARRTTVAVARGTLASRLAGETINADITALESYNEAIDRARALRDANFDTLGGRDDLLDAARIARPAYILTRSAHEAKQVFTLLSDPMGVLGEDQFPANVGGEPVDDACWRSPIAAWPEDVREALEADLTRANKAALEGSDGSLLACTGDIGPLLRVTDLLIESARWIERASPPASGVPDQAASAGAVKGDLYRVRAFLVAVLERTRRLAWVAAAAVVGDRPASFVDRALPALGRLTDVSPAEATRTVEALRAGKVERLTDVCAKTLGRIDAVAEAVIAGPVPGAQGAGSRADSDLLGAIALLLVDLVAPLAAAPPDRPPDEPLGDDGPAKKCEPGQLLHRVLGQAPVTPEVLDALEVVCLPEFVSGMPGRRRVDFRRLSTANRTPLAPQFESLFRAAGETRQWWDPSKRELAMQEGIHVALKLAGNELANFSAFLLAEWRANDWLWGRLDAVPTMVDLLVRPENLGARLDACVDDDDALRVVRELVVPPGHPLADTLQTEVWGPQADAMRNEVGTLRRAQGEWKGLKISGIRNALIARRQWEILQEEMALPRDPGGTSPVAPATDVAEWVKGYRVGAETLRDKAYAPQLLDRFAEISTAATEVALWNAPYVTPSSRPVPPIVATLVRRVGPVVGRTLAKRAVTAPKPKTTSSRKAAFVAFGGALILLLAILGWFIDRWAFLLGLVVSAGPLGALGWYLYRRTVEVLRQETAADERKAAHAGVGPGAPGGPAAVPVTHVVPIGPDPTVEDAAAPTVVIESPPPSQIPPVRP